MESIEKYLESASDLISSIPCDQVRNAAELVFAAYENEHQVFIMGNGGSSATASHLAGDLQKSVGLSGEKKFRVMALNESIPLMTAWANDSQYSDIYSGQLATWVRPGDLVIGLSGSGNSANVLKAIELGNDRGAVTLGICGYGGGRLAEIAKHSVVLSSNDMQHVEEAHMVIAHFIFRHVLERVSG